MRRRRAGVLGYAVAAGLAATLATTLTGCGSDAGGSGDGNDPDASASATGSASSSPASPTNPTSPTNPASPTGPTGSADTGSSDSDSTPSRPEELTATVDLLDWSRVPGPTSDTVTRGGGWTLTVADDGTSWQLEGPGTSRGEGSSGRKVSDALLDPPWAVVVTQDEHEQGPATAQVLDLRSGRSTTLDGRSDVPTVAGGTWALGADHLLRAGYGKGRAYCLATTDLPGGRSTLGWCAEPRHGFTGAHVGPGGDSVLSFDAGRPSCRTLLAVDGSRGTPFPGVPDCTAWDGLRTADGAVWSVVPNPRRIEAAHFYAHAGDRWLDLGPGTSGSLAWCGGAAWFGRDPQRDGDPAQLMRWSAADGLTVAYRTRGARAFLSAPRCGGDTVTVTAFTDSGDEQVSAPAG